MSAVWIIMHEYEEGASPRLVKCRSKPTQAQAKKIVGKDFKPRAGDTIRVIGPYDWDSIPELGKRRGRKEEPEPEEDPEPFDPFEEEE